MKRWTRSRKAPGAWLLLLALVLVAGCEWVQEDPFQPLTSDKPPPRRPTPPQEASNPLSGYWIGQLDGAALNLSLAEADDRSVSGVVDFAGTRYPGVYVLRSGTHLPDDTVHLDASPCDGGGGMGCLIELEGVLGADDELRGTFRTRMGHDPFFVGEWYATRQGASP
jgi:hypothetical protein